MLPRPYPDHCLKLFPLLLHYSSVTLVIRVAVSDPATHWFEFFVWNSSVTENNRWVSFAFFFFREESPIYLSIYIYLSTYFVHSFLPLFLSILSFLSLLCHRENINCENITIPKYKNTDVTDSEDTKLWKPASLAFFLVFIYFATGNEGSCWSRGGNMKESM